MKYLGWVAIFLLINGCAKQAVYTDYDPSINFKSITHLAIDVEEANESPSARHIASLIESALEQADIQLDPSSQYRLRVSAAIEQRVNDQTLTIGLGSTSGNRHSSIGIGTAVNLPLGDDMIDFQTITLDLIKAEQIIWTATDMAKIKVRDGKGVHQVQQKIVNRLIQHFPVIHNQPVD